MGEKIRSIRGTRDVLPPESARWRYLERTVQKIAEAFGYGEIRTPTIEKTELFVRSVGDTTDVVQKEMYTFDMGRDSITLRPEGTAGVVRAVLQNGMLGDALPQKLCYTISCFRHERPQAGRYREFHQFGAECLGSASPGADAEIICLADTILRRLGISQVTLFINSIGCQVCRPAYNQKLVEYYRGHAGELCELCRDRLERNPLRLLDCKEPGCAALKAGAPLSVEHLCAECGEHFSGLKTRLDAMRLSYEVNPYIVRGLDYYTKTVFEFVSDKIGAQGTVCGGGRYDLLVEQMGGAKTPALGFAMGLERLLLVMEAVGVEFPPEKGCDLYIGSMGGAESIAALGLACALRGEGFSVLCDTMGRSVKAQMKYADKQRARFCCIIGSNELQTGKAALKNMADGQETPLALDCADFGRFLSDAAQDNQTGA